MADADYLEILDWLARNTVAGKRGSTPSFRKMFNGFSLKRLHNHSHKRATRKQALESIFAEACERVLSRAKFLLDRNSIF
jgi:hypothetical protein